MSKRPAWLDEKGLQQLFAAIAAAGGEAQAVGGCVRDFLLGKGGSDVDVASTLDPETLMQLADGKWKAVPTGIEHGTITVVLPERVVEVTTLRKDVETDGRHAKVEYTDNFEEDAARRDFTINALYMDAHGEISDFFGGEADLAAKYLHFIGDADARIEEDALRILRYFRFLATLGWSVDSGAKSACKTHLAMLDDLSGERIQQEMKKLLAAKSPAHALEQMDKIDVPEHLTGGHWELGALKFLLEQEAQHGLSTSPFLRLAVMLPGKGRAEMAAQVCDRWKLSRADRDLLKYLCADHGVPDAAEVKMLLLKYDRDWVIWRVLFHAARSKQDLGAVLKVAREWQVPTFPVTAKDLLKAGMQEGPELGKKLKAIEQRWAKSDYTLTKKELLAE